MLWARRRLRRAAHHLHGSSLRDVAGFGSLSGQLCVARSTCDQQASGTGRAVPMDGLSASCQQCKRAAAAAAPWSCRSVAPKTFVSRSRPYGRPIRLLGV